MFCAVQFLNGWETFRIWETFVGLKLVRGLFHNFEKFFTFSIYAFQLYYDLFQAILR